MTWLVVAMALIFGVVAYREHLRSGSRKSRRKAHAWVWAFWGGIGGSFFGIAGLGGAVVGSGVGALIGYLAASALMKVDEGEAPDSESTLDAAAVYQGSRKVEDKLAVLQAERQKLLTSGYSIPADDKDGKWKHACEVAAINRRINDVKELL